ncbi:hypothetical protein BSKO_09480 [Bryopsis sp. KO-2023]|nr:hypothetical protein BSKO_09480 [Bryopsis sp. KO-2023]
MFGLTRLPPCRVCGLGPTRGLHSNSITRFRAPPRQGKFRRFTTHSTPESSTEVAAETKPDVEKVEEDGGSIMNSDFMPPGVNEENKNRVARYKGTKASKRPVTEQEGQRPLSEYMALPVSQYSVLDAAKIDRLDENTFKCYIGSFKMFRMTVEPILTVNVIANEKGCSIKLLDCELSGSDPVKAVNGIFAARMSNIVSWEQMEGKKMMSSDCTIEVAGLTPKYMRFVPIRVIEGVGNALMQQILNISVPRFLKQLEADYENWAKGDDSRGAVGTGEWGDLDLKEGAAEELESESKK